MKAIKLATAIHIVLLIVLNTGIVYTKPKHQNKHAITFITQTGRLGDQICTYAKTKWLSHKYRIPLLFNPFVPMHSDVTKLYKQLTLFDAENRADSEIMRFIKHKQSIDETKFQRKVTVRKESDIVAALNKKDVPTLFLCSLGTDLNLTYKTKFKTWINKYLCDRNMQTYLISLEKRYGSKLKKMLSPLASAKLKFPKKKISVAVHMRIGEGYDWGWTNHPHYYNSQNYSKRYNFIYLNNKKNKIFSVGDIDVTQKETNRTHQSKLRFLPKQYYVDQIINLSKLLNNAPLFVYIFTDAKDAKALTNEIREKVGLRNITWDCRDSQTGHNFNIIEDLDAMSQFDCLICPSSNFSLTASLLGDHKIIIRPVHAKWIDNNIFLVDEVSVIIRENIWNITLPGDNRWKN